MLSNLKTQFVSFAAVAAALVCMLLAGKASAADILTVYNDMNGATNFWLISEHDVDGVTPIKQFPIRRGQTIQIQLVSPDRFFQGTIDDKAETANDPLPLHQMIQQDPNLRLVLDGDLRTMTEMRWVYDKCHRRWMAVPQQRSVRVATILRFQFSNGQEQSYYLPSKLK